MLLFKNVKKNFRNFTLDIPYLSVGLGETIGLVGNNGAGKTTFLKLLLDLFQLDEGEINNFGERVNLSEDWKKSTGSYLDENFLIPYLKPFEYLKVIQNLKEISEKQFDQFLTKIDSFSGDTINSENYIRELSRGNKLKIGITGALINNPRLLILDEPFSNLDPTTRLYLSNYLNTFRTKKSISIISSHNLDNIRRICNRFILLDDGKVIIDKPNKKQSFADVEKYFNKQIV